ncbi:hypothetical protein JCM39068_21700 [Desulfocastanea catecholica]
MIRIQDAALTEKIPHTTSKVTQEEGVLRGIRGTESGYTLLWKGVEPTIDQSIYASCF